MCVIWQRTLRNKGKSSYFKMRKGGAQSIYEGTGCTYPVPVVKTGVADLNACGAATLPGSFSYFQSL